MGSVEGAVDTGSYVPPAAGWSHGRKGIDMVRTHERAVHRGDAKYTRNDVTGWVAWVFFAGVMMVTGGFLNAIEGFVALFRDDYYLVRPNGLVVNVDFAVWGWTLLIFGLLLIFAGYGVMAGQMWARVTGVIVAVVNSVVNLAFVPAYPIWAVIGIAIDVIVIYALVVHGREAKRARS